MNKLIEMSQMLYNTPHLLDKASFDWVESVINAQTVDKQAALKTEKQREKDKDRDLQYNEDTQVGVISIHGPLTYIEYEAVCGEKNASYQQIEAEFDGLVKTGATTIVLDVDSPGGMAYGLLETGRYLREKADANGVKLIAYVDGYAASAGMGLTAAAHEIIANPEAELGSIGVVVKLRNMNKAMKELGVEDTYIYAGKSKIPFNNEGEFAEEFLKDVQDKVDALYERFTSYVAEMQNISVEAVKATEAKMFMADKAVELGLAHKTMTRESFFEYLADTVQQTVHTGDRMLGRKLFGSEKDKPQMKELETLKTEMAEMSTQFDSAKAALATAETALAAKTAELETAQAALVAATEKLNAYTEAEEKAKAEAEAARIAGRKAALSAAVGDVEAEALYASLETLPDAAFDAVVAKMAAAAKSVEETPMFKEVGRDGDKGVELSTLDRLLAEKYPDASRV